MLDTRFGCTGAFTMLLLVACGNSTDSSAGAAGDGSVAGASSSTGGTVSVAGAAGASAGAAGSAIAGASSAGSAGSGGSSGAAGSPPDPGSEGDGDFTIGNIGGAGGKATYTDSPLIHDDQLSDSAKGKHLSFTMQGSESTIYPGIEDATTGMPTKYSRYVGVYLPPNYQSGSIVPFMVTQDQSCEDILPQTLNNLIATKQLPRMAAIFVASGGGNAVGSQRGLEYDTVSGLFAEFIDREVLPRVVNEVKKQLNLELKLTTDPEGRGTIGLSSGGVAGFSMAWFHADLFRRVISYSGSFIEQVPPDSPFPHGGWVYHDVDPYFQLSEAPRGLIMQRCESAASFLGSSNPGKCDTPLSQAACLAAGSECTWETEKKKPVRVWIESGSDDISGGNYFKWDLANQRMAAAFKARGYHYHYDHALDAGHIDGNVIHQTLPEAMLWVWRGYPIQ